MQSGSCPALKAWRVLWASVRCVPPCLAEPRNALAWAPDTLPLKTLFRLWPLGRHVHDEYPPSPDQGCHIARRMLDVEPALAQVDFVSCLCELGCGYQHRSHVSHLDYDLLLPEPVCEKLQKMHCRSSLSDHLPLHNVDLLTISSNREVRHEVLRDHDINCRGVDGCLNLHPLSNGLVDLAQAVHHCVYLILRTVSCIEAVLQLHYFVTIFTLGYRARRNAFQINSRAPENRIRIC